MAEAGNKMDTEHQREVMHFAQDAFNFLSKKRFSTNEIPKSRVKTNFNENIGDACAYLLQFSRHTFLDVLGRNYPDSVMDSRTFVTWFGAVLNCSYSREPYDPFAEAIESLAWMFESAVYAYKKGQTNFYRILPTLWTEYFQKKLYPDFFDKGGWSTLRGRAKDVAWTYKKFFVEHHPGTMELIANLRDDSPAEGATGGIDPAKQIRVPNLLRRAGYPAAVDESSSLAQTMKGIHEIKIKAASQLAEEEVCKKQNTLGATSAEELPGCRKEDSIRSRLGGCPSDSCPPSPEKTVLSSSEDDEFSFTKSPVDRVDRRSRLTSEPCSSIEKKDSSSKNERAKDDRKKKPKKRTSGKRKK